MLWLSEKEESKQTLEVFNIRCIPTKVLLVFHTAAFYNEFSSHPWKILNMQKKKKETWFLFFEVIVWEKKKKWDGADFHLTEVLQAMACL